MQRRGRLPEHDDELVEDRPRRPLDHAPRVDRDDGLDAEGYPAADQSVEEAVGRETLSRGLERDRQQPRDGRLGYEQRPPTQQHGRRHRQGHHDPDLDRPRADREHEQVSDGEPAGHPEDQLDRPPSLLADRHT